MSRQVIAISGCTAGRLPWHKCNNLTTMVHKGHNHPSGCAEPSAADRAVTQRLKQALALVDVRLLDHFVIGDGPPQSMAARGWV